MRFQRAARRADPTRPLGVLVVGFGHWGRNYVRVLNEMQDANVVAVCDQSADRLEAAGIAFPELRITADWRRRSASRTSTLP